MFMHLNLTLSVAFLVSPLSWVFKFVFYSYGVGHDFHDNIRDMFKRKMASRGTVAHGNSPSLKYPFGFCSWSLPSQSQFVQMETRRCCPSVSNTLKNEVVAKICDVSLEQSQKNYEMRERLVYDISLPGKSSTWAQTALSLSLSTTCYLRTLSKRLNLVHYFPHLSNGDSVSACFREQALKLQSALKQWEGLLKNRY